MIAIFDLVAIIGLVWRYHLDTNKLKTEIARLKSEITKEKIDKVILLAKYKREYFSIMYCAVDINRRFNKLYKITKRPSDKLRLLFEEMDKFMFQEILPSLNEMSMIADYFYSDDSDRRLDFIEEIIVPCFIMLENHFSYFNQPDILKKSKQTETVVFKENLLTTTRFLLASPDSEPKRFAISTCAKFIVTSRIT